MQQHTVRPGHLCTGPSCWTCGEPDQIRHLRQYDVMPALHALRQERPEADHHALAQTAVRAIRPTLMRGLEADNLLREVLAHADGTWSPPGGLAEIADHIRTHLAAG